ncbi:GAF domain-containing protein [Streptomyces finlayi]|uniref:GAF domain-containing protein n=1 Tax=Streptomyces finlayi TaxID=67296 RepID=A0A918WTY9_9ACTN|nr:ANTAR domain-containing protein [Streptomyces finlayi]GHC82956.1 GAF domain-containing protein [Streptomyces finlayi]
MTLVAEQAAQRGARVDLRDVCTAAVAALPVGGAGISAMSTSVANYPLCSTDGTSEQLEELQLTLGEGPCVDAFTGSVPILTPDMADSELQDSWPVFATEALTLGAVAIFALPLQIGAISPGVLDLYASKPGPLGAEDLADALAFADLATLILLDSVHGGPAGMPDNKEEETGYALEANGYRAEIDQATGILTVQLGVGIDEAFVRLRAHAFTHGHRITHVAADVVAHRLRFRPDAEPYRTDQDR